MVLAAEDRRKREEQRKRVVEIRQGIGAYLRQFYDQEPKEPMPPRIGELLWDLDQRLSGKASRQPIGSNDRAGGTCGSFWSGGADDPLDLDVPSALTALWL